MTNDGIPYRNPSGLPDPTAHDALASIMETREDREQRVARFVKTVRNMADLAGYDLIARIEIRDRETGRCYR